MVKMYAGFAPVASVKVRGRHAEAEAARQERGRQHIGRVRCVVGFRLQTRTAAEVHAQPVVGNLMVRIDAHPVAAGNEEQDIVKLGDARRAAVHAGNALARGIQQTQPRAGVANAGLDARRQPVARFGIERPVVCGAAPDAVEGVGDRSGKEGAGGRGFNKLEQVESCRGSQQAKA